MILKNSKSYAIIQTSGKQLLAIPEHWHDVNLLKKNILGDFLWLSKIVFFQKEKKIQLGMPFLENFKIPAKILQIIKGKKLRVLKNKPKKNYTRIYGYRQYYTRIKFDFILNN